jgi:hypothetical protein
MLMKDCKDMRRTRAANSALANVALPSALPCRLYIGRYTRQGRHYGSTTFQLHEPTRLMTAWIVPFRGLRCLAGVLTA